MERMERRVEMDLRKHLNQGPSSSRIISLGARDCYARQISKDSKEERKNSKSNLLAKLSL